MQFFVKVFQFMSQNGAQNEKYQICDHDNVEIKGIMKIFMRMILMMVMVGWGRGVSQNAFIHLSYPPILVIP